MRSEINVGGQRQRPTFNWLPLEKATPVDHATGQLIESLRNVSETMLVTLERIEQALARMDRRLAKRLPLRGGR